MISKMEPPASQNPKKLIKKASKKHSKSSTPKSGLVVRFLSQNGMPFSSRNAPKITTNPNIVEMGPRASKRWPRAPKMTKNDYFCLPKSRKSHCGNDKTCKQYPKMKTTKRHGGGIARSALDLIRLINTHVILICMRN